MNSNELILAMKQIEKERNIKAEVLIDAMEHPEKYPSLVVRVSGFSAIYVTLAREVQEDILSRTQQQPV